MESMMQDGMEKTSLEKGKVVTSLKVGVLLSAL